MYTVVRNYFRIRLDSFSVEEPEVFTKAERIEFGLDRKSGSVKFYMKVMVTGN